MAGWVAIMLSLGMCSAQGTRIIGPWVPIFKGIDHLVATNEPANTSDQLQVVHVLRVDLRDPDISFLTTPRIPNYIADVRETAGLMTKDFLQTNHVQAAINANVFDPTEYYLPPGTTMVVSGVQVSQGVVVSTQEGPAHSASIQFTTNNEASFIFTNWPPASTEGVYTAVSGEYPILVQGVKARRSTSGLHNLNPRTAFGLSQDKRYLFLMTLDGRQDGYSDGAYDDQTADWLVTFGAYDGINMDGGGSTTLVIEDSTGVPIELNHSNAVAGDPAGRERTLGSHFGIFAKPVPGFINDVIALPDDTAAIIKWTTTSPSSSQVEYGLSTKSMIPSEVQSDPATNHAVLLSGLVPGSDYYYRVHSTYAGVDYTSDNFHFVTTNYLSTNHLFDVESDWKYTSDNLDSVNWTAANYDDSQWSGPGGGLLWIDVRAAGPNPKVVPKNTELPANPDNSGFPFSTYYFRKHFNLANAKAISGLSFGAYVDDGAIFYVNGAEAFRLRMADAPEVILNSTLASDYPCRGTTSNGDAACVDEFWVGAIAATNLVEGDNVLAVEVHNYDFLSPDITFGTALAATSPNAPDPKLTISYVNGQLTLSWTRNAFALQSADAPSGMWADVPGPILASPYTPQVLSKPQFYRLRR